LQDHFEDLEWDDVHSPGGAFNGAWWHFENRGGWNTNIQIEEHRLVMKTAYWGNMGAPARALVRNQWFGILQQVVEGTPMNILRPQRWGNGQTMTAAHVGAKDERLHKGADGYVDLKETIEYLRLAMASWTRPDSWVKISSRSVIPTLTAWLPRPIQPNRKGQRHPRPANHPPQPPRRDRATYQNH
jgi:hypothetical protein